MKRKLRHPIRSITEPFGKAGLTVAILALVLATTGAAFAAGKFVTKPEAIKIAKKYAGKPGANGATGPAGPAGANGTNGEKGATGEKGANGTNGENGKSVVTGTASAGECTEGGITVEVEGSGTAKKVCNGEEGKQGPTGPAGAIHPGETLPSEATETGAWSFSEPATPKCSGTPCSEITLSQEAFIFAPIPFPIPLATTLDASHVHYVEATGLAPECPGTLAEPKAAKGNLCVYQNVASGVPKTSGLANAEIFPASGAPALLGGHAGAGKAGAVLFLRKEGSGVSIGWGSWAVTAG